MLQADDQHTMHYWLQELQMRRKVFHKLKSQSFVLQVVRSSISENVIGVLSDNWYSIIGIIDIVHLHALYLSDD